MMSHNRINLLVERLPDSAANINLKNGRKLKESLLQTNSKEDVLAVIEQMPEDGIVPKLYAGVLAGFITADEKENQTPPTLIQKLKSNIPTSNTFYAWELGRQIALQPKIVIPEDIKDKETYQKLVEAFKINFDAIGPDPLEGRKKQNYREPAQDAKQLNNFVAMLQQFDLAKIPIEMKDSAMPIHQFWAGRVPANYKEYILSWKKHNPHLNHVIYLDRPTVESMEKGDNQEYQEFKKFCQAHKISLVNFDAVLESHPAYPYLLYELDRPNYGAASDIARCILLSRYGGYYFDIPDVRCLKPLKTPKNDVLFRNLPGGKNNDALAVVSDTGKKLMASAVQGIIQNYQGGYETMYTRARGGNLYNSWKCSRVNRRVNITQSLTGVCNLFDVTPVEQRSSYNDEFFQAVKCDFAGTWVKIPEHATQEQKSDKDKLTQIKEALTDIIISLHFEPRVLDLDKYPIFKDVDAVKIALTFLGQYFPHFFSAVKNIACFNTEDQKSLIQFLIAFPLLSQFKMREFVDVIYNSYGDNNLERKKLFLAALFELDPSSFGDDPLKLVIYMHLDYNLALRALEFKTTVVTRDHVDMLLSPDYNLSDKDLPIAKKFIDKMIEKNPAILKVKVSGLNQTPWVMSISKVMNRDLGPDSNYVQLLSYFMDKTLEHMTKAEAELYLHEKSNGGLKFTPISYDLSRLSENFYGTEKLSGQIEQVKEKFLDFQKKIILKFPPSRPFFVAQKNGAITPASEVMIRGNKVKGPG